jgi:hypothetical protein
MIRLLILLALLVAPAAVAQTAPDTLRHLAPGTPLVVHEYAAPRTGYVLGHNSRRTEEYAEKYHLTGGGRLIGVVAHLGGVVANANNIAEFNAYRVGTNRLPSVRVASKQVLYGSLDLSGGPMLVRFNAPVTVADSFFVSLSVGDYSHGGFDGDAWAVLAGPHASRAATDLGRFGRNAVRLHNHTVQDWVDLYLQNFTPLATHLALFPVIEPTGATAGEGGPVLAAGSLALHPVAPNPTSGAARVGFSLAAPADHVRVEVYDATGRRVEVAHLGARAAGPHGHALFLGARPPGLYLVAVSADADRLYGSLTLTR